MSRSKILFFTLPSIFLSYFLIYSGIAHEGIFIYDWEGEATIVPVGGFAMLITGLFLFGVNLYLLQTIGQFSDLTDIPPARKYWTGKAFIIITLSTFFLCCYVISISISYNFSYSY